MPEGIGLDPGGIGKGLAADLAVRELRAAGTGGVLVALGGDIACAGRAPDPAGWLVDIEDLRRQISDIEASGGTGPSSGGGGGNSG